MAPLAPAFPHVEVQAAGARFDLHNAGTFLRVEIDLQARRVDVVWSVEDLLRARRVGPCQTAIVTLAISGVSSLAGTFGWDEGSDGAPDAEEVGLDFIEYIAEPGPGGTLRIVLTPDGEVAVTGTDCELIYTVGSEP